jgi:Cys-tRNA(Pro)/Cys-tRNA(Cys) deacylase
VRDLKNKAEKTNVMRILEQKKLDYKSYTYESDGAISGVEVAAMLGFDENRVFKTLVTESASKNHYVFMIPVAKELDLKKAAAAVSEKSVSMLKSKDLLPLTGYVHGGCSPIGMKKQFRTVIDRTAGDFEEIVFSAGKIGFQVEITLEALKKAVPVTEADLTY